MAAITITTTHTCLPFGELDEKSKGLVRDKYGDFTTSFDWWLDVYSGFALRMESEKGLIVDTGAMCFAQNSWNIEQAAFTAIVGDFGKFVAAMDCFDKKEQDLLNEAWDACHIDIYASPAYRNGQSSYCMIRNPYSAGEDEFAWAGTVLHKFAASCRELFQSLALLLRANLQAEFDLRTTDKAFSDAFRLHKCVFEIGTGTMFHTTD